jgi:hypothetical protein
MRMNAVMVASGHDHLRCVDGSTVRSCRSAGASMARRRRVRWRNYPTTATRRDEWSAPSRIANLDQKMS